MSKSNHERNDKGSNFENDISVRSTVPMRQTNLVNHDTTEENIVAAY